jgi:phosphonate ABC transporter substrate-binding protein
VATPKLKTALATYGNTQAAKDGAITPRTFDFDFEDVPVIIKAFRRMVRGLEFDIAELAMTTYLCAREHGKQFTAIPVFPMRAFHHGAILMHRNHPIANPKDLEGRRVGVNRGYTVTASLWARSVLQHEHGIDLSRITWVLSGDEHVAEYRPPSNVVPIEEGRTLEEMLASGELAAATGLKTEDPDLVPLIPNAKEAGMASLRRTGFYPINHTVVVRNDVLASHPDLAEDLFNTLAESKRRYVQRLKDGQVSPMTAADQTYRRVMEVTGDPLPCGIEPNRRALEAIVRYSVEQGILRKSVAIDELFASGSLALTG